MVYIAVEPQEHGQWLARVTDRPEIFAYGSSFKDAADKASDLLHRALANCVETVEASLETEDARIVLADDFDDILQ